MNTHDELREAVGFLFEEGLPIGTELYFVMKDRSLRKVSMGESLELALTNRILTTVREEIIEDDKKVFGPMSEADERNKVLCYYDLGDLPAELSFLVEAATKPVDTKFHLIKDGLANIFGIIYRFGIDGKSVTLFKLHKGFDTITRGSRTILMVPIPSNDRMERLESTAVKLTGNFDLMLVNGHLIVTSIGVMESTFKVDQLIRDKAAQKLKAIEESGILKDVTKLSGALQNLPVARKLNKASRTSTVLQLEKSVITRFVEGHLTLSEDLSIDKATHKIEIKTNKHVKVFLQLLDDDFLRSELTGEEYEALLKNRLDRKKKTKGKSAPKR